MTVWAGAGGQGCEKSRDLNAFSAGRRPAAAFLTGAGLLAAAGLGILTATAGTATAAPLATVTAAASSRSCQPLPVPARAPAPIPTVKRTASPPTPTATAKAPTPAASTTAPTQSAPPATPVPSPTFTPATATPASPSPTPTAPASSTAPAGAAPGRRIVLTAATTASLCIEVVPLQQGSKRGKAAAWDVTIWTTGSGVPAAAVTLRAAPAGSGTPKFTVGCAKASSTPACDLGAISPAAAQRQLEAQDTVPLSAHATSVTLTAVISTADAKTRAAASSTVTILTSPAPAGAPAQPAPLPGATAQPLPGVAAPVPAPVLSQGGDAGTLFPALTPGTSSGTATAEPAKTHQVADTATLSGAISPIGPALVGTGALALALIFAVTRRPARRPRLKAKKPAAAAPQPVPHQEKHSTGSPGHVKGPPVDPEAT